MTSDTLIEIKKPSTEFSVHFRVGFELNFGHIFASH